MAILTLPRTAGCLVCGRDNPRGLGLRLTVDDATGTVAARAVPTAQHIGFADVVHGGLIATVADEAMVWAATWRGGRFCLCGELTVRFRKPARPGQALRVEASVESARSRLITTRFRCLDDAGDELSSGSGKYVPLSIDENRCVLETFVVEPDSQVAADVLRAAASRFV